MGVLEDLAQARADYERGEWAAAFDGWTGTDSASLDADDLDRFATAATLLGRRDVAREAHQREFRLREEAGDTTGAVRCCFRMTMLLATAGDHALAAGWTERAEALARGVTATEGPDAAASGYVAFLRMFRLLGAGDLEGAERAADAAAAAGRAAGDVELQALGLCGQGRAALRAGRAAEGLTRLDEALAVMSEGGSPLIVGQVYCVAIEGCQEISDLGRVVEWTAALTRWCAAQPGLVLFTGQRSLHRGQVMRQRGGWDEALEEFAAAVERYAAAGMPDAAGVVEAERGDLLRLRGDLAAADAAYQRAAEHGHDPQPGLALLWLARGSTTAAAAAVRRLVAEATGPVDRSRVLPAAVEVLLAAGAVEEARGPAADLERVADALGSPALLATAAQASGAVQLAGGDPAGALPYLRRARQLWARVESPYDAARVRRITGEALLALGDRESARRELDAARQAFVALGARPDVAAVDRLLTPEQAPGGLTAREVEVLRLVAAGRSNPQVAAELVLSEKTVARHLSNIFAKLDVGSRTAAAAYAFEHGLV